LSNHSRLIQNSKLSKKIISFIDKILVVNFLKIYCSIIFMCSIVYVWNLDLDYDYVWRTDFSIAWLVAIFLSSIAVYVMDRYGFLKYNKKTLILILFIYALILLISYFTLTLSHTLLLISYMLFISSFILLWMYCKAKKDLVKLDENDSKIKFVNIILFILSAFFYFISYISDPLMSTVLLCVFPFYILPFFIGKGFSLFISYRPIFFIYLFFISSTIYPYLFLSSLILFFISKFYFFVKFGIKYPTFLEQYDLS